MLRSRLLLSVALTLVAPLAACAATAQPVAQDDDSPSSSKKKSSTKNTATDEDETSPSDDESPSPSPSSSSTTTPAPSDTSEPPTGTPNPQCGGQQGDACIDCCIGGNEQASAAADQAFESCICQSACASACGNSLCQGRQPSAACEQCMQGSGGQQCESAWVNACNANAACRAIDQCIQTSCGGGN